MMKKKTYWAIVGLCFLLVFGVMILGPGAQDSSGVVGFEPAFSKVGLQYRFENGWADQFSGKVIPVNNSALFVEWYRYDDETGFLNSSFHNPEATEYRIFLEFYLDTVNQTGKTTGTFYVEWFKGSESLGFDQVSGNLVIRDNTRAARAWTDILRARKYTYTVGDLY